MPLFDLGLRYRVETRRGVVVQLVRTLPCHGRGRGFESRRPRHFLSSTYKEMAKNIGVQKGHVLVPLASLPPL